VSAADLRDAIAPAGLDSWVKQGVGLFAALTLSQRADSKLDFDYKTSDTTATTERMVLSRLAVSVITGVPRWKSKTVSRRLASLCIIFQRAKRAMLEIAVVSKLPRSHLISYLDFNAFDGTPIFVSLSTDANASFDKAIGGVGCVGSEAIDIATHDHSVAVTSFSAGRVRTSKCREHVIQSAGKSSMVVRLGGAYVTFFIVRVDPLIVTSSSTGDALMEQQLLISGVTAAKNAFLVAERVSCTDLIANHWNIKGG
jgi:hypothetical protein